MVVVSGNWVKNVATYPASDVPSDVVIGDKIMAAKAILTCRPNSHHFQERTLILDQPVKVGRSVARAKPTSTNAIFDCKVLSRHHALLWYETGKFYLQDTKSSNGTFVNNNRLPPDNGNQELSSGDIVQFGVDVVENNRKVTHGCIIANIKLYLPDGKEAKASPVTDGGIQSMVPLDELYKLNKIIQEANQREQCLESKLQTLQMRVDQMRKAADESWKAYVGEERLLSRIAALENQLQQASKGFGEDRLKEQFMKLMRDNDAYQEAAKKALDKLHADRMQAISYAMEEEQGRLTANGQANMFKEIADRTQVELEKLAYKMTEYQKKTTEERAKLEKIIQELEEKLENESGKLLDIHLKLHEMNAFSMPGFQDLLYFFADKNCLIYNEDNNVKSKEDIIGENEDTESLMNQSNGLDSHINLMVGPVDEKVESEKVLENDAEPSADEKNSNDLRNESNEEVKRVSFKIPEDTEKSEEKEDLTDDTDDSTDKEDAVDSKTLKYQFHAAQSELKRKIETLETIANAHRNKIEEMEKALEAEKSVSKNHLEENELLKQELVLLKQKWKECCNENQQQKDKMLSLNQELQAALDQAKQPIECIKEEIEETQPAEPNILKSTVSYEQMVQIEEELVLIKERFAQVNEEKLSLKRDLISLKAEYDIVCNRFYNKVFWYVMPLIGMVLYLLISAMVS